MLSDSRMFELGTGEIVILGFIVISVVSWPWWPRLGEAIALLLVREASQDEKDDPPGNPR